MEGNVTDAFLLTAGLSTEICIKIPNGSFSVFQQYNILTGKHYKYAVEKFDANSNPFFKSYRYSYISSTYAVTIKNMTYFLQQNVDPFFKEGSDKPRLYNIQAGINYKFPLHTKQLNR